MVLSLDTHLGALDSQVENGQINGVVPEENQGMIDRQRIIEDVLEIAQKRGPKAGISRRSFNQSLLLLGALAAAGPWQRALSANGNVIVSNWGGDAVPAFETSYSGFNQASGNKLQIDGSGPSEGALKTQVNSGAVRCVVVY